MKVDRIAERKYLERCADAFMVHLDQGTFGEHMDEWTIFGGDPPKNPLGFYKTHSDAVSEGYRAYGLQPFLMRKITPDYAMFGKWGVPKLLKGRIVDLIGVKTNIHPRSIVIQ